MRLRLFQVDAFADHVFSGNPAAVCPLDAWLPDATLQAIAEENNLSETAFFVTVGDRYELRWFTPVAEVDLCGHATLATAHVIFGRLASDEPMLRFQTRGGELRVTRDGDLLTLDFPAIAPTPCAIPERMAAALGCMPAEVLEADDYIAVLDNEAEVRSLSPDHAALKAFDRRGVVVTAPGEKVDFVSRFFAPKFGIAEDPVTGSTHCELVPYWAERLDRTTLSARQVSRRGGELRCRLAGDRVFLSGRAVTYLEGEIEIGEATDG